MWGKIPTLSTGHRIGKVFTGLISAQSHGWVFWKQLISYHSLTLTTNIVTTLIKWLVPSGLKHKSDLFAWEQEGYYAWSWWPNTLSFFYNFTILLLSLLSTHITYFSLSHTHVNWQIYVLLCLLLTYGDKEQIPNYFCTFSGHFWEAVCSGNLSSYWDSPWCSKTCSTRQTTLTCPT